MKKNLKKLIEIFLDIITHNRAIMAEADVLYGVTMQGDGVSRLLSLKLGEAQEMEKE